MHNPSIIVRFHLIADQPKELPTPKQSDQHRQLHHMSSAQNSFPSNDQLSSSNSLNIPNHGKHVRS